MKRLGIVWFRNDLRLHDNEVGFIYDDHPLLSLSLV